MQLSLCRKMFASQIGRSARIRLEVVDPSQNRILTSLLTGYYLGADNSLQLDVLSAVDKLRETIMIH